MDNDTISAKGTKQGLDKLESVISIKNLRGSIILSDNLCDELSDCSDYLRAVAEKVDATHTSVIINKHNMVTMTWNRGGMRGTDEMISYGHWIHTISCKKKV